LIDVSCKGCGERFEEGDCVLVQSYREIVKDGLIVILPERSFHYIPWEVCKEDIFFDCFQRSLGKYHEKDLVGVYHRGEVHTLPEIFFKIDRSGIEVRARFIN
jgi:hypothetical protein